MKKGLVLPKRPLGEVFATEAFTVAQPNETLRDLALRILAEDLATEENTDALIRVLVAKLPFGLRTIAAAVLDRLLPGRLIEALRTVLSK